MTSVNNGGERWDLCHEGTEPVTSDATVSSDMWLWHLTCAGILDNCFSQIQSPDCFSFSRERLEAAGLQVQYQAPVTQI